MLLLAGVALLVCIAAVLSGDSTSSEFYSGSISQLYTRSEIVQNAKYLHKNNNGKLWPGGCSEFVAKAIGKTTVQAQKYVYGEDVKVESNGNYKGLTPGDLVCIKNPAHVAIYIGEKNMKFLDVPDKN